MTKRVAVDDLIDAQGVADILQLAHRNTVSQYQRRYDDMPKPAVDLGEGRVELWLRSEMTRWVAELDANGRTRPARRVPR
jgi:hypothetical protein